MRWKKNILVGSIVAIVSFGVGFLAGLHYGDFMFAFSQAVVSFALGFGFGEVFDFVGLFRELYNTHREDKREKHRAWKQRVLTAYDAYIESLASIKYGTSGVYPSGYCINDYGWPDVPHRHEAETFLVENMSDYEDWKNCVQCWNDYIISYKTRNRTEVDVEFRMKIIAELSKSGIPRKQEESVRNKNYADYDYFATRIETFWKEGDELSYSVGRLRQTGHADNPDDKVLEKLADISRSLICGNLKQECKEALNKLEKDVEIQNQAKSEKWNILLEERNDFLVKLKQLRDDIDADRKGQWN